MALRADDADPEEVRLGPASGDEFGEARLLEILERNRGRDLPEILDRIVSEVKEWTRHGPQHDDVTIVLARCR